MPPGDPFQPPHPPHPPEGMRGEGVGEVWPKDLSTLLTQLGLGKYLPVLEEQDVDLQVFLTLTDHDLKEIGIKLFGPRKKMTNAIARWHSKAPLHQSGLERAYADHLEGEMQDLAVQLNQAVLEVERLRGQVQQERQLRSVAEGCLMEERTLWQAARQRLQELHRAICLTQESACHLKQLHGELREAASLLGQAGFAMETMLASADCRLAELLQVTGSASSTSDLLLTTLRQAPTPELPASDPYS